MARKQQKTTYVVKDVFKEPDKKKREQEIIDIVIKHIKTKNTKTGGNDHES